MKGKLKLPTNTKRASRVRGKAKGWRLIMPNGRGFKASLVKKFKAGGKSFAVIRYF